MRLIPLPRQLRAYWLPGTPAFWITPAPANFVHCMPLIARLLSASMHVFFRTLRTLASCLLRPPHSRADNTAAQCSIISIPPTPAGFVPLWSTYPLPCMFASAVCALDLCRLPVHCTFHRYSIPAPHAACRPPPDPTSHARTMPATHALALCWPRAFDPAPRAACRPPPDPTPHACSMPAAQVLALCCPHARSPSSPHSIPAARTLVLCSFYGPPRACTLLGPAVFVFSPPTAPFP
ncbi:hypothetical protein B0H14DRAFT_3448661 [Mycena olivaceomarginata]|nr:hypothetical protein B0H14DRAFT_3448661 [Mycena olivaceomarginata]